MGDESWSEYCKLVMSEIERLDGCVKELKTLYDRLLWTGLGGAFCVIAYLIGEHFFQ